jgi:virginiamycin B lyase
MAAVARFFTIESERTGQYIYERTMAPTAVPRLLVLMIALNACGSRSAVSTLDDQGDGAPDPTSSRDKCSNAPPVTSSRGVLDLTAFDAGFLDLPLLTTGPDGALWFTTLLGAMGGWALDRFTPEDGAATVKLGGAFDDRPPDSYGGPWGFVDIATGPDGRMWSIEIYTYLPDASAPLMVMRTAPDGSATALTIDGAVQFGGLAKGPDGNMWLVDQTATEVRLSRVSPRGVVTPFATDFPLRSEGMRVGAVASGSDGNLWLAAFTSRIDRMTVDGELTDFPLAAATDRADIVTPGPDGNVWFLGSSESATGQSINLVGRVTPTGCISEFRFELVNHAIASSFAADPEGNLWLAADDEIARLAPSGAMTEFPLPLHRHATAGPCTDATLTTCEPSAATAIALGPDGHVWFTNCPGSGITQLVQISAAR